MKKIILAVILMAAAGGIAYYLLQNKKQVRVSAIDKKFVPGKWKIDSLVEQKDSTKDGFALLLFALDSTARDLVYNFQADGKVFISHPADTSASDTASFTWVNGKELLWKENIAGTAADTMTIVRLDRKDFVLQSRDSILIYLKKIE